MTKPAAKYLVPLICSDRSTHMINILSPRIDLNAFHLLYGRHVGRTIDDVRESGDIYVYPNGVSANFVDDEPCSPSIVARIVRYIKLGEVRKGLFAPDRLQVYRRHWDFFGLSPESFSEFHSDLLTRVWMRSCSHDHPAYFQFKTIVLPIVDESGAKSAVESLVCEFFSRDALFLYDAFPRKNGSVIELRGGDSETTKFDLSVDNDGLRFDSHFYKAAPLLLQQSAPSVYRNGAFTDNATVAAFLAAVSLYFPFYAAELKARMRALQLVELPMIVVAHGISDTKLYLVPRNIDSPVVLTEFACTILIRDTDPKEFVILGSEPVNDLFSVFQREGRAAMFAWAHSFIAKRTAAAAKKRKDRVDGEE